MLRSHILRQVSPGGIEFIGAVGGNSSPDVNFSLSSYTFGMPAGVAAGDMYVLVNGGNRGHNNFTPLVGGNAPDNAIWGAGSSPTTNDPVFLLYYGTLTAAEVSVGTVTLGKSGGTPQDPTMACAFFRGVSTFPTQTVSYSTTMTPPNVPVNCDLAIVGFVDEHFSGGSYTAPSGWTEAIEQASTDTSNHSCIFYKIDTISSGTSVGTIGGDDDKTACSTFGLTI
jgi:hypothetical protein